jgi:hypothetical protein
MSRLLRDALCGFVAAAGALVIFAICALMLYSFLLSLMFMSPRLFGVTTVLLVALLVAGLSYLKHLLPLLQHITTRDVS